MKNGYLSLSGIGHRYGKRTALSDITLSINGGEILLIMGPNGAGKTTLVSILAGLLKPCSGSVFWKGSDIHDDLAAWKRAIGVVHEQLFLFQTLTLRENLFYTGVLYDMDPVELEERITNLLTWFDLADRSETPVHEASFGMKKKLAFALALLHNPDILLLDEALNGIDIRSGWNLRRLLRGLADNGKTILMSTHNLGAAYEIADRYVIIDSGRIIKDVPASGSGKDLEGLYLESLGKKAGTSGDLPWLA